MEDKTKDVKKEEKVDEKQLLNESLNIIRQACAQYKGTLQEHNVIQTALNNLNSFINS